MNLYNVSNQYRAIENILAENGGDLTPELETLLNITEENRDEAVKSIFYLMSEKEDEVEALKTRIEKLSEIKKRKEITMNSCKKSLETAVMQFGELSVDEFKLKTRISKSVNVYDEDKLPKEYLTEKISYVPDKKAIGEILKKGEFVNGAELITKNNLMVK